MRRLGLDWGSRAIGVAVSDPTGTIAHPLTVIRSGEKEAVAEIAVLCRQYEVVEVVVGLPRRMNGTLGSQAQRVQNWAKLLEKALGIPVVLWDERLTSRQAERALLEADLSRRRRRQVVDAGAAAHILQSYLDAQA